VTTNTFGFDHFSLIIYRPHAAQYIACRDADFRPAL